VIAEPPLSAGAVHDTTAREFPGVAVTADGAPGTVLGVVAALASDSGEVPIALVAFTVNVYAVPLARPVIVAVLTPFVLAVTPPGDAVTVYPVMAEPPLLTGAVHDTTAWAFPGVAVTAIGAPGTVVGVTAALGIEASELPAALAAVTVNVYAVPLTRPVTVRLLASAAAGRSRPTWALVAALTTRTLYPVIAEPPSATGAVHDTTARAFPGVAVTAVGAPGTVLGVVAALASDSGEVPIALVAVTVNV
jgi:hypothetical protein